MVEYHSGTVVPVSKSHCPDGETGSFTWLSFIFLPPGAGPKQAMSRLYCILKTKNCDVLPFIMHKVVFASPPTFHIFVEMYVCG